MRESMVHNEIAHQLSELPTAEPSKIALPDVRRLEAVSFRSWPASTTAYDGTWAIRLTAGHPSKRLNSVNPLDPGDSRDLEQRVERVSRRFNSFGRALVFRQSPLAPPELEHILDSRGWDRFDETMVMTLSLADADLDSALDQVPLKDVGRWIDRCVEMRSFSSAVKPGLSELIDHVHGEVGLFVLEQDADTPQAACMAVRYGDLLGIFEVVSNPELRRQGHGRKILRNALRWGREQGAQTAWLQVVSDNKAARTLYEDEGFSEVYRYAYRQAPGSDIEALN
ncbi:MAG: GNAT family N-acetyltransferase [Pseudomonadota bacterium]